MATLGEAIWSSAWGCLSNQMESSRLPIHLFSKNKCVPWLLCSPYPLHSALSLKPLGEKRVPICACSMLRCLKHLSAEAGPCAEAECPLMGSLFSGHLSPEASCLKKNISSLVGSHCYFLNSILSFSTCLFICCIPIIGKPFSFFFSKDAI